jgi:hypothetical protein
MAQMTSSCRVIGDHEGDGVPGYSPPAGGLTSASSVRPWRWSEDWDREGGYGRK